MNMLSSFTVKNFKSYREATLELAPLTVLTGANAAGKSNLLEALRLLSWVAQGNQLASIRYALEKDDQAIRGTVQNLGFRGGNVFSLACRSSLPRWNSYSISLKTRENGELRIEDEELGGTGEGVPLLEIVNRQEAANQVQVAYHNFAQGSRKPRIACNDQMSVLAQLQSPARFGRSHPEAQRLIPEIATQYLDWLSSIVFLDPQPSAMRNYGFKTDRMLRETGANLSGVLFNLCAGRKDAYNELLDLIKALPEQDFKELDFIDTPRGETMVRLIETLGGKDTAYDATLLSDGTLRVLALGAAALASPEGSLIVIEGIDSSVHPSRAKRLLEHLARLATARNLRIILDSHDPALLDALPDDAIPHVVFCYRDPETGASRLTRLMDLPDYPELVAQGKVGQLLTCGIIERSAKNPLGPEERKQRLHAWLDRLQAEAA